MYNLLLFVELKALGVSMQNLLLLADLKALSLRPCRSYCFSQNRRHWACGHAELITFGRTKGIGRAPMRNVLLLAELKALGVCPCSRTDGIGRLPMWNALLLA